MSDGQRVSYKETAARLAKAGNEHVALLRDCRRLLFDLDLALKGAMTIERWRVRRGELVERIDEACR